MELINVYNVSNITTVTNKHSYRNKIAIAIGTQGKDNF